MDRVAASPNGDKAAVCVMFPRGLYGNEDAKGSLRLSPVHRARAGTPLDHNALTMSTFFHDEDDRNDFDRHSISDSFIDFATSPPAHYDDAASAYSFYSRQRSGTVQSFDSTTPILPPSSSKQSDTKAGSGSSIRINTNRLVCSRVPLAVSHFLFLIF